MRFRVDADGKAFARRPDLVLETLAIVLVDGEPRDVDAQPSLDPVLDLELDADHISPSPVVTVPIEALPAGLTGADRLKVGRPAAPELPAGRRSPALAPRLDWMVWHYKTSSVFSLDLVTRANGAFAVRSPSASPG